MANNRLVLLLAVALVGMIGLILGAIATKDSSAGAKKYLGADDQARLENLKEKVLQDEEIKDILSKFQNQNYEFYYKTNVRDVLAMPDALLAEHCIERIVREEDSRFEWVKNRTLTLNLYKFTIKPWVTFCAKNIKDVFKFIMEKNGEYGCNGLISTYNFLKTLEFVSDEPLSENYSSLIKGQYEELHNECKKLEPFWNLRSISCNEADSEEYLRGDDLIGAKKVSEKIIPDHVIEFMFDSFEQKDFRFCGIVRVEDVSLFVPLGDPWYCMDRIRKIESTEFASVENEILAKNLHKFNARNLLPYCAVQLESVIKYITTGSKYKHTCASLVVVNRYLEGLEYFTGESFSRKASQVVRSDNKELFERCSAWDSCIKRAPHIFSNVANTGEEKASKIALGANTKQVSLTDTEESEDSGKTEHDELNERILNKRRLPLTEISHVMHSFEDDRFVFFGNLNVRDMFDLTIFHQISIKSCVKKIQAKVYNPFAYVQNSILAYNLYKFTLRDLIPFCAEHFEAVIKSLDKFICHWLYQAMDFSLGLEHFTGDRFKERLAPLIREHYGKEYDRCIEERYFEVDLADVNAWAEHQAGMIMQSGKQ